MEGVLKKTQLMEPEFINMLLLTKYMAKKMQEVRKRWRASRAKLEQANA
jgi:hypothetical protein